MLWLYSLVDGYCMCYARKPINLLLNLGRAMFKGFNVSIDSLKLLPHSTKYNNQLTLHKASIRKSLKDFMFVDGSIDGDKLKQAWFPDIGAFHVFISHSHKDLALAEGLASWLYEKFEIYSFIDSHVWGYANELLKLIDNKYAMSSDGNTYHYDIRNETTSHVHMMLSSALNEVIDSTESLFFLNTDNAIKNIALSNMTDDHRTASPWIMSELKTSNIIKRQENVKRAMELKKHASLEYMLESVSKRSERLHIQHKAPIEHLTKLSGIDLLSWSSATSNKKYDALTVLYNQKCGEHFSLLIPSESKER